MFNNLSSLIWVKHWSFQNPVYAAKSNFPASYKSRSNGSSYTVKYLFEFTGPAQKFVAA